MIESLLLFGVIFASISTIVNVMLVWYLRRIMKRSSLMYGVTTELLTALEDFSTHLDNVHELPLFYGDETLKGLLDHSKELVKYTRKYRDGFIFGAGGEQIDAEPEEGSPEEG